MHFGKPADAEDDCIHLNFWLNERGAVESEEE